MSHSVATFIFLLHRCQVLTYAMLESFTCSVIAFRQVLFGNPLCLVHL